MTQAVRIVATYSVPTTIPTIGTVLNSLQGKKSFAMEEGPMAGWLYRNLNEKVEKFIVSEPRRNKLKTCEGDRDDRIDSGKLAALLRGNFRAQPGYNCTTPYLPIQQKWSPHKSFNESDL